MLKLFTLLCLIYSAGLQAKQYSFVDAEICPLICPSSEAGEGFLIDIMRDALAEQDHELNFSIVPYQRALAMVRSGEADGLPIVYREDAPDLLYGSSIFYKGENQLFVKSNFTPPEESDSPWTGLKLAVIDGYTFGNEPLDHYLKAQKKSARPEVIFMSGNDAYLRMIQMLDLGRIDGIIDDRAFILHAVKLFNDPRAPEMKLELKPLAHISYGLNIIAYTPKKPEQSAYLMNLFDNYIENLYESGRFNDYLKPYGLLLPAETSRP